MEPEQRIGKTIVEVRYPPRFCLLDKRGEVVDDLLRTVGPDFRPNLRPDGFDLADGSGTLVATGPANFSVTHELPRTIAPTEQLTARAWRSITTKGGVPQKATRFGTRFWVWWKVPDEATGWERLTALQLVSSPGGWEGVFGPAARAVTVGTLKLTEHVNARVKLEVARNNVHHGTRAKWVDHDQVRLDVPDWVIQADIDIARHSDADVFELPAASLDTKVREHWQRVSRWISELSSRLEARDGD